MLLVMIFVQDMRSRSVYWFMFPLLAITFFLYRLAMQSFSDIWPSVLTNIIFLGIQMVLVGAWFSLRNRKWTNLTTSLLGWGDILLLISIAFGLSVFSFLFFYIASLTLIALYWAVLQNVRGRKDVQVPLAGLQALLLTFVLTGDWWLFHLNLTSDDWMFKLIGQ